MMGWRPWRRHRATVIYKNGVTQRFWCAELTVEYSTTSGLASIEWKSARPRPLYANPGAIEAVWIS